MPGIDVHVYNKGVGGQDADEMVDRMQRDVKPEHAHLVVWQVGTNSAIRRDPARPSSPRSCGPASISAIRWAPTS